MLAQRVRQPARSAGEPVRIDRLGSQERADRDQLGESRVVTAEVVEDELSDRRQRRRISGRPPLVENFRGPSGQEAYVLPGGHARIGHEARRLDNCKRQIPERLRYRVGFGG